jgi:hypothetical protein
MSRLMSVAYTEDAVLARIKTVTRRTGWWRDVRGKRLVLPGHDLTLCRKVMGRKKGEPLVRLVDVEVVDVRREPLARILEDATYGRAEVALEGFPDMEPIDFVRRYFLDAQGLDLRTDVTRIEWAYLDRPQYEQPGLVSA